MQIFVNTFFEKRVEQLLALLTSYREPFPLPVSTTGLVGGLATYLYVEGG